MQVYVTVMKINLYVLPIFLFLSVLQINLIKWYLKHLSSGLNCNLKVLKYQFVKYDKYLLLCAYKNCNWTFLEIEFYRTFYA